MRIRELVRRFVATRAERREEHRRNWAVLERELATVAPECERQPYERLLNEEWITSKTVDGRELWFSGEVVEVRPDGTLWFAIVARGLPLGCKLGGALPSWGFFKLPDGTTLHSDPADRRGDGPDP